MANHADRRRRPPPASRSRPIILLELAAPVSDDRNYSGWNRFFDLTPAGEEADTGSPRTVPMEG